MVRYITKVYIVLYGIKIGFIQKTFSIFLKISSIYIMEKSHIKPFFLISRIILLYLRVESFVKSTIENKIIGMNIGLTKHLEKILLLIRREATVLNS